jgi:UDP-glucose 4-epimerase
MSVLVSGGLGYIGSHTVVELLNQNYDVVVVDNLINSNLEVLKNIKLITKKNVKYYNLDATNENELKELFLKENITSIIHFAGYKSVNESISNPEKYYHNNLISTINLSICAIKFNIDKIIFSSSATVYGNGESPFFEDSILLKRTNPYGETKAMSEKILIDISKAYPNISITLLRYFNPVGAHKSGLIGEKPNGVPNNLMPFITQVAKGKQEKLRIFGNDYETIDGTGVRDYIHVVDLAKGHLKALKNSAKNLNIYNLGTGKGTSVLELVKVFQKVNNIKIPYEIVERRPGDISISYADCSKANRELNWKATHTIEDMVRDSWNFEKNIKEI